MLSFFVVLLVVVAFITANLPWLSDKIFGFLPTPEQGKRNRLRWLEWLVYFFLIGLLALGLEYKATGGAHAQDWEFYVVAICLFVVFALPGFLYRTELYVLLKKQRK